MAGLQHSAHDVHFPSLHEMPSSMGAGVGGEWWIGFGWDLGAVEGSMTTSMGVLGDGG